MLLTQLLDSIRIELQDTDEDAPVHSNDDLIRAVSKSISLMSRLLPKRTFITSTVTAGMLDSTEPYLMDISSILNDIIRIERVEYPANSSPPAFPTFEYMNGHLIFRADLELTAGDLIRLTYLCKWTMPTPEAVGDYPSHLDDAIIIGSSGQALIFKAEKYMLSAVSLIDSSAANLAALPAVVIPTAPDISGDITALLAILTTTELGLGAAVSNITNISSVGIVPCQADLVLEKADIVVGVGYLTTGAALINIATRGENVGAVYGQYATAIAQLAAVRDRVASTQLALGNLERDISSLYYNISSIYVQDVVQRLSSISRKLEKYTLELEASNQTLTYQLRLLDKSGKLETNTKQYIELSGRFLASGQAKIQEFLMMLGVKPEFVTQRASAEQRD